MTPDSSAAPGLATPPRIRIGRQTGDGLRRLGMTLCACTLAACTVGPDFVRPTAPDTDHFAAGPPLAATVEVAGQTQRFASATPVPADWWTLFGSAPLDAAVQQALAHNPSVQIAQANLRQAQHLLRAGQGLFAPQLTASLGATRARSELAGQNPALTDGVYNLYSASGTVSYAPDVFGGQTRTIEGLGAEVDLQAYNLQASYITLTANLVNACIARAGYTAQIAATQRLLRLQQDQLHSVEARAQAGTAPFADVLTQRSAIAATRTLLAPLQLKRAQTGDLLALLQGQVPSLAIVPEVALDSLTLPLDLPAGVPSQLVHQRPDILAAEATLHAASAAIGVASAARYPDLLLSASYGTAAGTFGALGSAASRFWSLGPSLTAPLFNGGALRARQQAAVDAFDAQQAQYRQTVLGAFAQVADTLKALEFDAEGLQAQRNAQVAAADALALTEASYRAGLSDGVAVMAADGAYQQALIGTLQAQVQRHQDTVALFVALGGGWRSAP